MMPDWPDTQCTTLVGTVIHPASRASNTSEILLAFGNAAWPAANRALYVPFVVERTCTAYQMAIIVGAQAGNCDVGIYDVFGNRLVSMGSTAVGAAGLQTFNIADTVLTPGNYFAAMNCDTTTTLTVSRALSLAVGLMQAQGYQQQAVGAVTLPDPATFANVASAYIPNIVIGLRSAAM